MLDFKREKVSGQLAAHSEAVPFRIYWIEELAYFYLTIVQGGSRGVEVENRTPYDTVAEAKQAAQAMEAENED